mgnify:CR=1 FL=1
MKVARALVEAAGQSPEYEGEEPLLVWLDVLPELVIPVLRVKGGARAAAELRRVLEERGTANQVEGLRLVDQDEVEIRELDPHIAHDVPDRLRHQRHGLAEHLGVRE